jgi:ABC transport system ATP-binding/permease protein
MPPIVTLRDLSIRYRGPTLFEGVECRIEAGQRIGLLGRNGAGKSTLLKMLCQEVEPDHGSVTFAAGTKVSVLPQEVPQDLIGTTASIVSQGVVAVDERHVWEGEQQVKQMLSRMALDATAPFERLSAGMKRRVLLARSLVCSPDLLLLDEPTNHLDIESIEWLETFLGRWSGAFLFVTHDRVFLRKLANRILEIDRGKLFDWSCDYDTFLERKEAALAAEERQEALFDKKLAEEEVWIRTGIKARRTRNEGRVRALEAMRSQRQERRQHPEKVQMEIQEGARSGQLVANVENVSFAYGERPILQNFSTTILRGDKIGIIGPNGAGKSTLLRILLGEQPPQSGRVRLGSNLQIAYFDQLRLQLNEEQTVQDCVADGYDTVFVNGQSRHVVGYLSEFLFSPDRVRTPIRFLSGGERNRLLLAKLLTKPANVFVLDEPTNDLDAETLELLEERLVQFNGTILLVSHDRQFLNNVVSSTIVFENGNIREYVGGYDDWQRQRTPVAPVAAKPVSKGGAEEPRKPEAKKKLSYKQQQELANLPANIEKMESDIAALHTLMADPAFYRQPGDLIATEQAKLKNLEQTLTTAYARWEELEAAQ